MSKTRLPQAILLLCAPFMAACATVMPTPSPTAPPTATAWPAASAIPSDTPTSPPSATPTATYALTPPAVMRLEDASREVLGWLDPERAARIDDAFYITAGEVSELANSQPHPFWIYFVTLSGFNPRFPSADSPELQVFVMASSQGMDVDRMERLYPEPPPTRSAESLEWPENRCFPVSASRRQQILAVFDASTGQEVGEAAVTSQEMSEINAQLARAGRRKLPGATALPTQMPKATAILTLGSAEVSLPKLPPDAAVPRRMGEGEVLSVLADVAREVPFVAGATWSYRMTGHSDNVRWSRYAVTRTIDAGWQIAPEVMVVHQTETATLIGGTGKDRVEGMHWFIFPEGIAAELSGASLAQARAALAAPAGQSTPDTHLGEAVPLPLRVPDRRDRLRGVALEEAVKVAAGSFPACFAVQNYLGGHTLHTGWLCRGAGFVRHELPSCGTSYGGYDIMELTAYSIPAFKLVGEDP